MPGVYAQFSTSEGSFTVKLHDQEAPRTVENFVGLAEGTTLVVRQAYLEQGGLFYYRDKGLVIRDQERVAQRTQPKYKS